MDRYRILHRIGKGGMGEVYLAEDTQLERKVALKFLPELMQKDATARKRLEREAKSAAPNPADRGPIALDRVRCDGMNDTERSPSGPGQPPGRNDVGDRVAGAANWRPGHSDFLAALAGRPVQDDLRARGRAADNRGA